MGYQRKFGPKAGRGANSEPSACLVALAEPLLPVSVAVVFSLVGVCQVQVDQQSDPYGPAAQEIPLITWSENQGTNRRLNTGPDAEGLSLPVNRAIDRGGGRADYRVGGKQQVMFTFETPVPFATEGHVIAESKIALQIEVAVSTLPIKIAAG